MGQNVESQELSFKHVQENLLGSKEVGNPTEVVEKADGLLLTTTQEGPGTVVWSSGNAHFDGDVSWSIGVRQEVKDAAGRGIEVGGLEMRRANEERIFSCDDEAAAQARKRAGSQALQQVVSGVLGHRVVGFASGRISSEHLPHVFDWIVSFLASQGHSWNRRRAALEFSISAGL